MHTQFTTLIFQEFQTAMANFIKFSEVCHVTKFRKLWETFRTL